MRMGILGGTFDPIHHGHLFIAEEARARFQLDEVVFVPNGQPPHKSDKNLTPAPHRYAMTRIAIHPNAHFRCSPLEIRRPGPSYTVDTLAALREQHPSAEFFYITGIDAVAEILTWKQHEVVIQQATFLAAPRPGFDLLTLKENLPAAYLKRIMLLGSMHLGISSTDIRERIRQGLPARYLLPDAALNYILRNRLYQNDTESAVVTL